MHLGPRDFVGTNAISEIETKNMYLFTKEFKFDMTISLHAQGKEIYWEYNGIELEKAKKIGEKFAQISGYTLTKPNYTSSFAGYKDWFIEEFKRPGFTIELGEGEEGKSFKTNQIQKEYNQIKDIFWEAIKST